MAAHDLLRAAAEALGLLASAPLALLLAGAVFLLLTETLTFIPRIGFVLKLCVASLLATQMLVLFKVASLGEPPQLRPLFEAVYLPLPSMLVLCLIAVLPFLLAVGILALRKPGAARFFFGNVLRDPPPSPRDLFLFKLPMHLLMAPFIFVPGAMVLKGLSGLNALKEGLVAALVYWPAPLAVMLLSMAFDGLMSRLPGLMPRRAFAILMLPLLLAWVLFWAAFTYALSASAFGLQDIA